MQLGTDGWRKIAIFSLFFLHRRIAREGVAVNEGLGEDEDWGVELKWQRRADGSVGKSGIKRGGRG
jgi:hypothetical protein